MNNKKDKAQSDDLSNKPDGEDILVKDIVDIDETSQNEEKGVQQRKLSFSLKRTKPTEEGSN